MFSFLSCQRLYVLLSVLIILDCLFSTDSIGQGTQETEFTAPSTSKLDGREILVAIRNQRDSMDQGRFAASSVYWASDKFKSDARFRSEWKGRKLIGYRKRFGESLGGVHENVNCFGCYKDAFVGYMNLVPNKDALIADNVILLQLSFFPSHHVSRHERVYSEPEPKYLGLFPESYLASAYYRIDGFFGKDGPIGLDGSITATKVE